VWRRPQTRKDPRCMDRALGTTLTQAPETDCARDCICCCALAWSFEPVNENLSRGSCVSCDFCMGDRCYRIGKVGFLVSAKHIFGARMAHLAAKLR
jgi:hypothetical protein